MESKLHSQDLREKNDRLLPELLTLNEKLQSVINERDNYKRFFNETFQYCGPLQHGRYSISKAQLNKFLEYMIEKSTNPRSLHITAKKHQLIEDGASKSNSELS